MSTDFLLILPIPLVTCDTWHVRGLDHKTRHYIEHLVYYLIVSTSRQSGPGVRHWAASWPHSAMSSSVVRWPVDTSQSQCAGPGETRHLYKHPPGSPCYKQLWHLTVMTWCHNCNVSIRSQNTDLSFVQKLKEYVDCGLKNILETCYLYLGLLLTTTIIQCTVAQKVGVAPC